MWSKQSRGRMAQIAKKTKRYPSDLTDEEWEQIAPLMPKPGRRGRPREIDFREVINAVRYLVRSGCGWRMLPIHFGPWQTVYGWFRELARRFLFQTIHDVALMLDRERAGRQASPTAGVIDSQSVKAPQAETRGYDAGKKMVGRKRHIAVDTDGAALDGQSHHRRHLRQRRGSGGPGWRAQALALGEASVRRQRLRPAQAHGQSRLPQLRGRNHPSVRRSEGVLYPPPTLGRDRLYNVASSGFEWSLIIERGGCRRRPLLTAFIGDRAASQFVAAESESSR